ncbi:hypothetical protein HMI01_13520 [Halolactibacillus miurensis]|uniref:Virus attachment protein p12 family protein n=1 Tax=Halolactibacillus miurensis TaxID=306541 RepID=A0A1I6T8C6_9BACI|nr:MULTISPECIES: FeoB-associated Cys-rich membrane protein [Halolactibacillus]GEM04364.1 hypothetical protein HMI01_13520 [Halolactibacillus miurensis]SFS85464.1 Virus attachment protein p12 family protein [Halolactibacillus miurensis]
MLDILIGFVIFGYACLVFVRHIRLRKQSKCAACPLKKHCEQTGTLCMSKQLENHK